MTVDPKTGNIYIIYYDRRNYPGVETEVFLARSDDGGINFTNHKISETPFIPSSNIFFGDYSSIAAYDGNILPMWMRMDNGVMSVWTAPMKDNDLITSVYQSENLPYQFRLYQNYPNPFNPATEISWEIKKPTFVILKIYDMLGREIETLANEFQQAGTHNVSFTSKNLSSGIYYYRLETENQSLARKMILLR